MPARDLSPQTEIKTGADAPRFTVLIEDMHDGLIHTWRSVDVPFRLGDSVTVPAPGAGSRVEERIIQDRVWATPTTLILRTERR